MKYYVYIHKKADIDEVFYVGKGQGKRAFNKSDRTQFWKNVEKKHGRTVEILCYYETEYEANKKEIELISEYKSLGCKLVNLTEGGEGRSGRFKTKEEKLKISNSMKGKNTGPLTEDHKNKISQTMKNKGFDMSWARTSSPWNKGAKGVQVSPMKGRKHSEEARKKISENQKGRIRSEETRKKISIKMKIIRNNKGIKNG